MFKFQPVAKDWGKNILLRIGCYIRIFRFQQFMGGCQNDYQKGWERQIEEQNSNRSIVQKLVEILTAYFILEIEVNFYE